ncbi:MAG: hypothetical protein ACRC6D_09500 [Aeromonas sp.]
MSNISMFKEAEKAKQIIVKDGKIFATQKGMAMAFDVLLTSVNNIINTAKKHADIDFSAVIHETWTGSGASVVQVLTYYPFQVVVTVGFRLRKEGAAANFMERMNRISARYTP